jgi:hypothetical protein
MVVGSQFVIGRITVVHGGPAHRFRVGPTAAHRFRVGPTAAIRITIGDGT